MAMQVQVTQESVGASCRLLQRMFPGNEKDVPNLVFGTNQPPVPIHFSDPGHPFTQELVAALNQNMIGTIICITACQLRLNSAQVDNLAVQDPRVTELKQRVLDEIAQMPKVQQLRAERMQIITQWNNRTLLN